MVAIRVNLEETGAVVCLELHTGNIGTLLNRLKEILHCDDAVLVTENGSLVPTTSPLIGYEEGLTLIRTPQASPSMINVN